MLIQFQALSKRAHIERTTEDILYHLDLVAMAPPIVQYSSTIPTPSFGIFRVCGKHCSKDVLCVGSSPEIGTRLAHPALALAEKVRATYPTYPYIATS